MTTHESTFRADDTYTLISRLRQNVIKTGLRTMSLTYSRISLRDVCLKLGLDSEETTEYIVAKAIRDGVIEATINHEGGYMQNKEVLDVYATEEPMLAFDERIRFCMTLHNEAIKVSRTPCPRCSTSVISLWRHLWNLGWNLCLLRSTVYWDCLDGGLR